MTLEEFLAAEGLRNHYIDYKDLEIYVRKGPRYTLIPGPGYIIGRRVKLLDIANITNRTRVENVDYDENYKRTRTGLLREFDSLARICAATHGLEGIYYENVLNPWLRDKLLEMGYVTVPGPEIFSFRCYILLFAPVHDAGEQQ